MKGLTDLESWESSPMNCGENIKEIDSEGARLSAETESLVERTSLLRERCAEAHEGYR